jgi:hypothetical protein
VKVDNIVLMLELNVALHVGRPKRTEVQSPCKSNPEGIQEALCPSTALPTEGRSCK